MTAGRVSRSIVVDVGPRQAYNSWIDFAWYKNGFPNGKARITEEGNQETHLGSTRALIGSSALETLTLVEEGEKLCYILKAPGIRDYQATVVFEEIQEGKTQITWTSEIESNFVITNIFTFSFGVR
mmetsp:Transcript_6083/g.7676  ORF Transcript_6083/g.7676 Transcript_6083/m.7676 type:complete len:126 (-) Transcript_6083:842-1219(-)